MDDQRPVRDVASRDVQSTSPSRWLAVCEILLVFAVFFVHAGDPPPAINEAHYLVLAKNFWQPQWCDRDLFVTSDKPHILYHAAVGPLTNLFSLDTAAWIARVAGWMLLAVGLRAVCRAVSDRDFVCVLVAVIWIAGLEWFNFAGEWVVGGIEAKVPAYALVLCAMAQMAKGNWPWVWPLLGLASAFHVLVGGWTVLAAMAAYAITGRGASTPVRQIVPLVVGGLIALIGLIPGLKMSAAADPGLSVAAAKIYTYARLSHHLLPTSFASSWYWRHGLIVVITMGLVWSLRRDKRFQPLVWLTVGCWGIALCGLGVGFLDHYSKELAARLLRYYWFRASDAITPLTLALAVAVILRTDRWNRTSTTTESADDRSASNRSWCQVLPVAVVTLVAVVLFSRSLIDNVRRGIPVAARFDVIKAGRVESYRAQQAAYLDWQKVCRWIDQTMPADEVFITPRHQQTFKWFAQRGEVVNWKDVPQDAASLVRWYNRFFDVYPRRLGTVRVTVRYDQLREMRARYGADFMVVDRRIVGDTLPLVKVYPDDLSTNNETYAIYRLPR